MVLIVRHLPKSSFRFLFFFNWREGGVFSCYLNFRRMSLHFRKNKTLSSEKTEEDEILNLFSENYEWDPRVFQAKEKNISMECLSCSSVEIWGKLIALFIDLKVYVYLVLILILTFHDEGIQQHNSNLLVHFEFPLLADFSSNFHSIHLSKLPRSSLFGNEGIVYYDKNDWNNLRIRKSTYRVSLSSNKNKRSRKPLLKLLLSINHIATTDRWNVQRAWSILLKLINNSWRENKGKSLPWRRFGYVIPIIMKFGELLLWISLRIINALRSYIKHSKECFTRYPNT